MPEQVRCPSCNAALRVPENLLGKNVRCPKCQTTFLAELEEPAEPERIVREPSPAARRRPRPPEDFEEEDELPPEDELEELPEEPEEEYEERPRRRRRGGRRRAAAEAAVAGPAISLIVIGSLDIFLVILDMILSLAGFNFVPASARGPGGPGGNFAFQSNPVIVLPTHLLGIGLDILILMGGIKMKQLQNHGLAMAASILAILPCGNPCCCIGLPIGIWALVVLNRPEVKDAFQ